MNNNQPKVIIVIGDATETVDTLYPYLRVQEEGFQPVVAGPEKRRFQMVLHEIPPKRVGDHTGIRGIYARSRCRIFGY